MLFLTKIIPINSIITFLGFLDTHLLIPIIALYSVSLGADIATVGLIVGIYSLTNIITNIICGYLIDTFSFKLPLIVGLCGDALAMLMYSFCQNPWQLLFVRASHGFSGGLVGPATMSITAEFSQSKSKGKAMSYYGMALAASSLIGYAGGGTIASKLGFNILFYIGSGTLFIAALLAFLLPASKPNAHKEHGGFISNIKNSAKLITTNKPAISYLSIFAQYFSFGGIVTLLPLYISTLGLHTFHLGIALSAFSLMFIIMQLFTGSLSDKIGRLIPTASGLILGALSLLLLLLAQDFMMIILCMALFGVAYGILFPSISALLADSVTPQKYGSATGIFHAQITIGVAAGAPMMGIIASISSIKFGLTLLPIIFIPALILTILTFKREQLRNDAY